MFRNGPVLPRSSHRSRVTELGAKQREKGSSIRASPERRKGGAKLSLTGSPWRTYQSELMLRLGVLLRALGREAGPFRRESNPRVSVAGESQSEAPVLLLALRRSWVGGLRGAEVAKGGFPGNAGPGEMSSQRGNVSRTRAQRHQNAQVFRNDKYDSSAQRKKINAKLHEGLCQHCKEVLEWRVKFNKYKPLTQPKKCVKCLQKTIKDSYHIVCKPCACELNLCAKCGKNEEIVIPIQMGLEKPEKEPSTTDPRRNNTRRGSEEGSELNLSDLEEDDEELDPLVKQVKGLTVQRTGN